MTPVRKRTGVFFFDLLATPEIKMPPRGRRQKVPRGLFANRIASAISESLASDYVARGTAVREVARRPKTQCVFGRSEGFESNP